MLLACKGDPADDTGEDDTDDTSDSGEDTGDSDDTDTSDSDDTDTAGTDTDTGDLAPYVVSIDPPDGAVDVPLNANITVTFSEPVVNTTVGASSYWLSGPLGGIAGTRTVGSTTAVFDPDLELVEFAHEYTVTLAATITDPDGNPLEPWTSTFRTVATDARYWYQLIPFEERLNASPGVLPALAVGDSPFACAVVPSAVSQAQQWRPEATGALANNALGAPDPNSLDGAACTLAEATALSDDERWSLVFDSECGTTHACPTDPNTQYNGLWRLQTAAGGTAKSLHVEGTIAMADTAATTRQLFQIRRFCLTPTDCQ